MRLLEEVGLTFDDLILVPRISPFNSRFDNEISLSSKILPTLELDLPIISANMDTVTEARLAIEMARNGGVGIIHRFMDISPHRKQLEGLQSTFRIGCIGVGQAGIGRAEAISDVCEAFLIDIAHGHSTVMIKQIEQVKKLFPQHPVIAGNVATYEGTLALLQAGADCIKVGVGPGAVCETRIRTGNGVPQATAIDNARRAVDEFNHYFKTNHTVIADGGCKDSGDIMKALAIGADAVMLGNMLAGTEEAPGEKFIQDGKTVKLYRGMASYDAQKDWKGHVTSVEGEATWIEYKGEVGKILQSIKAWLCSGFSYQGSKNIKELHEVAQFQRQTQAGYREGLPHAKS